MIDKRWHTIWMQHSDAAEVTKAWHRQHAGFDSVVDEKWLKYV